ncbi:tetratricopeptide repeat protein [candidate division CSSED10-310 bacterium]|uniref:Tetratricopeptide repeat protein n=1 Tax=candidate division CSSED10-310 bacterium TaxID=2855610 RepID=A0ABV6Z3R8_UNCC1
MEKIESYQEPETTREKDLPSPGQRIPNTFLLSIFLLGILSRLAFLKWGYVPEFVYLKYLYLSRNLFTPDWWSGHVFFSSPGYQFFMAFCEQVLGLTPGGIRLGQMLLGGLQGVLLALIVSRIASVTTAVMVGFVAALYQPFILHEGILATSILDLFLTITFVYFMYEVTAKGRLIHFALAGFTLGLAAIVRPNALLVGVFGAAGYLLIPAVRRSSNKITVQGLVAGFIGLMLPIIPVTLLNRVAGGEWVLITASSGNLLYSGNSYYANGLTYSPPESMLFRQNKLAIRSDSVLPVEHLMFWETANEATGRNLTAAESSAFWTRETLSYMHSYPGHTLKLFLLKALYFWNRYASHDIGEVQINEKQIKKWPFLPFVVVVPLGIAGIVLLFISGQWLKWYWVLVPVAAYWVATVMVFAVDRYRLPAFPFILAIAVWGLFHALQKLKEKHFLHPLLFVGLTLIALGVVNIETEAIRTSRDVTAPLFEFEHLALKAMKEKKYDQAERLFQQMIALDPGSAQIAHENLAIIAALRGDEVRAKQERLFARGYSIPKGNKQFYLQKIAQNPSDHEALIALGCLEWSLGNKKSALQYFDQAVEIAAWWPNGHFNRGIALLYQENSQPDTAFVEFQIALKSGLKFAPQVSDIHYHQGIALLKMGRKDQARIEFQKALSRDNTHPRARNVLQRLVNGGS